MPEDTKLNMHIFDNQPDSGEAINDNNTEDAATPLRPPLPFSTRPRLTRAEQARINGAKSRGPKTPRGKAVCSLNGLKHGRYMKNPTPIAVEDSSYYPEFLEPYLRRFKPADGPEYELISEIASIDWRLSRNVAFESRNIDTQPRLETAQNDFEIFELTRATVAAKKLVDTSKFPAFLLQQHESFVRSRKAIYETFFKIRQAQPSSDQTQIPCISSHIDPESDQTPVPVNPRPDQGPNRTSPISDPGLAA
jgi:hypothetical protein